MMKSAAKFLLIVMVGSLLGCGKAEKPLYDQVMDIHDEVMPKMNEIYKLRKGLQDSLLHHPEITEASKAEIEKTIVILDSANTSMMVWMRQFNPPDQKDKKAFEKYMEEELVKVKKMQEEVMSALERAKGQN